MYRSNSARILLLDVQGKTNREKISSWDNGVGAPAVGKPPAVTASAIEWGSREIHEQPLFSDALESSVPTGNILEGDLTQLVEKLHQLETKQLNRFVEELQAALREVALEPSDDLGTDVLTPSGTAASVSLGPDRVKNAAEEIAPKPSNRLGTPVAMSRFVSAAAPSLADDIERTSTEVGPARSDPIEPDVAALPMMSARVSAPPDAAEELPFEAAVVLNPNAVLAPVISEQVSSLPAEGEHAVAEEALAEARDFLGRDVVSSLVISERVSSPAIEIDYPGEEIALGHSDRLGTEAVIPPTPVSSRPREMQHPVEEIRLKSKDRLEADAAGSRVISTPAPSPLAGIEHAGVEGTLQGSDRFEPDAETPLVIFAPESAPLDDFEHVAINPANAEMTTQTLMSDPRHSSSRSRSHWGKRTGLVLALSAVTASIPWESSIVFENLPKAMPTTSALEVERSAPEPSPRSQVATRIAMSEGPTAPAAQISSQPLQANEIGGLIDRGDQFLRQGDIITARSFYERAAVSGSARAARGVAKTFDPQFLSQLGVVGVRGDPGQAAAWYRKANEAN